MTRETDTWAFNIGAENWDICAQGPTDNSIHPDEYLGQPCSGLRVDSNTDPTELEPDDLILARRSGGDSTGVIGLWRYKDKLQLDGIEQELWDDADYEWMLYCEPIQREFDSIVEEDWKGFADRIDDSVKAATARLTGAIVNLTPTYEREYLEQLLADDSISGSAQNVLKREYRRPINRPTPRECTASSPMAPYYWVNQTNNREELEEGYLQAPPDDQFSHDVGKLETGDIVFNYSDGQIIGYSEVTQSAQLVEVDSQARCRVDVDVTRFDTPLDFVEVFEYLLREDVRLDKYYPVNQAGINQRYLYNLSESAGEYLLKQGERGNGEKHSLVEHFQKTPEAALYVFSAPPIDWLTILRRGALQFSDRMKSRWSSVDPGDVVVFRIEANRGRRDASGDDATSGLLGGAVVARRTTKSDRWWRNESEQLVYPYLITFDECYVTSAIDRLSLETPVFKLERPELETEVTALSKRSLHWGIRDETTDTIDDARLAFWEIADSHAQSEHMLAAIFESFEAPPSEHSEFSDLPALLPRPVELSDHAKQRTSEFARRLETVGQAVFYGPPGTGKTYTATQFARQWVYNQSERPAADRVRSVTFHPSFTYEDFVEGLSAKTTDDGGVTYDYNDGTLKEIYRAAYDAYEQTPPDQTAPRYVLLIDEINRGDVSQILGELITLLEHDKRLGQRSQTSAELAHSGESVTLPPNLYLIGTMNTADQSISLIDAAIRRRFSFHPFRPRIETIVESSEIFEEISGIERAAEDDIEFRSLLARSILALQALNENIIARSDLSRGKRLGHSYLLNLDETVESLCDVWQFELLPLLEEYYFGDFPRLQKELFEEDDSGGTTRRTPATILFDDGAGDISEITPEELHHALGDFLANHSAPASDGTTTSGKSVFSSMSRE